MREEQKKIFTAVEGDRWFARNADSEEYRSLSKDKLVEVMEHIELTPKKVLEVGCSSGHNLHWIQQVFQAECYGIDPSKDAIQAGQEAYPALSLQVATAESLPFDDHSFDTLIFGFCLYLCDRRDLFKIAHEADRCLKNHGTLIIKDFYPPFAYKNTYAHCDGVYSYKMDYSQMFRWNPEYAEVANVVYSLDGFRNRDIPDEKVAIVVLRKNTQSAYPQSPFSSD
jgi:ubiquinone/menaquinone biosynthesis C-methylase UbiE